MHKGESKLRENRVNQSILEYTRKHLSRDRRNQKKLVKKLDVTIRTNWGNDRAPRILYSPRNEISNLARKRVINQCQMKQPPDLDHSLSNCSRRKTKELHTLRTARRNTCETNKPLEPRTTRYRGHLVVSLLSKLLAHLTTRVSRTRLLAPLTSPLLVSLSLLVSLCLSPPNRTTNQTAS